MTTIHEPRRVDEDLLNAFLARMIDVGATVSAALVVIGDRLGLYRAMADGQPVTAEDLATRTGTAWCAQRAGRR